MLDTDGWVIEGTMSNLFVIQDDTLITPSLNRAGIEGIMRERILAQSRALGIPVVVLDLSFEAVMSAQSMFFCNSLIGIWPVAILGDCKFQAHTFTERLMVTLKLS